MRRIRVKRVFIMLGLKGGALSGSLSKNTTLTMSFPKCRFLSTCGQHNHRVHSLVTRWSLTGSAYSSSNHWSLTGYSLVTHRSLNHSSLTHWTLTDQSLIEYSCHSPTCPVSIHSLTCPLGQSANRLINHSSHSVNQ